MHLDYSFLEDVAAHFANGDENTQQSDEEIVLAALDGTADDKLTDFALRMVLSDHVGIPHESQLDLLTEAEQVFAPKKPNVAKTRAKALGKKELASVGSALRKEAARKKAA